MDKIGIILTSIERPLALKKSVESIIAQWQENWVLFIGDQNEYHSESTAIILNIIHDNPDKEIQHYKLEYNCGISKARNELIHKASLWGCEYVLLTADSIIFDNSMPDIAYLEPCFQKSERKEWSYYDLIGLDLCNRIGWEAKLNLIPGQSFELDFIEKNPGEKAWLVGDNIFDVWSCDIVRNFWIAKTDSLMKVMYDDSLIMCEHEDFFWRAKLQGLIVGCTNLCSGTYLKTESNETYKKVREENFRKGQQILLKKYNLKKWVSYVHIERIQNGN